MNKTMELYRVAKDLFDDFVYNYVDTYDVSPEAMVKHPIMDNWREYLDNEANITFESLKIKYVSEYGFDQAFKLVRDYAYEDGKNLVELPKDYILTYLYYHLLLHVIREEFGCVEKAVMRRLNSPWSSHRMKF